MKVRNEKIYLVRDNVYASISMKENKFIIDKVIRPRVTIEKNNKVKIVSGFKLYMKKAEE